MTGAQGVASTEGTGLRPSSGPLRRGRSVGGEDRSRSVLGLTLLSVAALAVVAAAYLISVRVGLGQGIDDWLFEARKTVRLGFRRRVASGPMTLVVPLLGLAGVGAVVLAWRRRTVTTAVTVAAAMVATVVSSTVLKLVLPRPLLHDTFWAGDENSFPSGHMAGAMVVILAWVLITSDRRRAVVVAAGSVLAAGVAVGIAGSSWHRPSDIVGGIALAVFWAGGAGVVAALQASPVRSLVQDRAGPSRRVASDLVRWSITTGGLAVATGGLLVLMRRPTTIPWRSFVGYSATVLFLVVVASTAVALFAHLAPLPGGRRSG